MKAYTSHMNLSTNTAMYNYTYYILIYIYHMYEAQFFTT